MLLICCFLIERLLTFTLECFPWLSCYVNVCFCLPQRLFRIQPLGCDVTATECLFKKDKINWVNANWPFSLLLSCRALVGGRNVNKFANKFVCARGQCLCTWIHFDHVRPFAALSFWTRRDADARPTCGSLLLSPVCLSNLWNREWQRSDVSCGFYLNAQPEKTFSV